MCGLNRGSSAYLKIYNFTLFQLSCSQQKKLGPVSIRALLETLTLFCSYLGGSVENAVFECKVPGEWQLNYFSKFSSRWWGWHNFLLFFPVKKVFGVSLPLASFVKWIKKRYPASTGSKSEKEREIKKKKRRGKRMRFDPSTCSTWVYRANSRAIETRCS